MQSKFFIMKAWKDTHTLNDHVGHAFSKFPKGRNLRKNLEMLAYIFFCLIFSFYFIFKNLIALCLVYYVFLKKLLLWFCFFYVFLVLFIFLIPFFKLTSCFLKREIKRRWRTGCWEGEEDLVWFGGGDAWSQYNAWKYIFNQKKKHFYIKPISYTNFIVTTNDITCSIS